MSPFLFNMSLIKKTELIELPRGITTKEEVYEKLKTGLSQYLDNKDLLLVEKAYLIASRYHEGQKRKSGEDYIIHPLCGTAAIYDDIYIISNLSIGHLNNIRCTESGS